MRILIVDDSRFTRALLRREFEGSSEVLEAGDGLEALDVLESCERPDAVIVDLLMPRMNGFELVAALRERDRYDGPVVVCTANTQPSVERRVRELGATEFVPKPELLVPGRAKSLVADLLKGQRRDTRRPRTTIVHERPDALASAMDGVAGILNGLTSLPVRLARGKPGSDGGSAARVSLATVRVSVSLGGGLDGTASLSLPGHAILQAAFDRMGPTVSPNPTTEDIALEIGNILLNAFVAGLNEDLKNEIEFGELRCHSGPAVRDAAIETTADDALSIEVVFALEGVEEIGSLAVTLERNAVEELLGNAAAPVGTGPAGEWPSRS